MSQYERLRVPPLGALYRALDAGLTGEKPEEAGRAVMAIAASEGLDFEGIQIYDIAVHYARLATILATFLRGKGPAWTKVPDQRLGRHTWSSACYEAGDRIRRIALVDYWSDDRRDQELRGWRSQSEIVVLGRPLLLNALSIGHVLHGRRVSPWTRAWAHPQNGAVRFKRTTSATEGFCETWRKTWRESSDLTTERWLDRMQKDGVLDDVVHTVAAGLPLRVDEIRLDILRRAREMEDRQKLPPMRRTGCYGFSPCPFLCVCYGSGAPLPSAYGFRRKERNLGVENHAFGAGPESGPESSILVQAGKMG